MFETSRQLGRIPVVAVCGEIAFDQTVWLKRLLAHPMMRGSVVLSAGFHRDAELGFGRVESFVKASSSSTGGCLCCGLNSGLGDALRSLFLRVLTKRAEPVDRVVIDAAGLDIGQIAFTLKHAPFLGQRYVFQTTLTVIGHRAVIENEAGAGGGAFFDFDEHSILKRV